MSNKKNSSGPDIKRPTSPHLQIYRWNISSLTSILHRFTGVVLYLSFLLLSWYITYYTYQLNIGDSSETCDCPIQEVIRYAVLTAVVGAVFALYYHFCNGIRHLFWDIGFGFKKETAKTNGILVITAAILLTAVTVAIVTYFRIS